MNPEGGSSTSALFDQRTERRVIGGLLALVVVILVASAVWVSERALSVFDELLLPEFDQDAEVLAERLAANVRRARSLGIEPEEFRGLPAFLNNYVDEHPAILYLAMTDGDGDVLAAVGPEPALLTAAADRPWDAGGAEALVSRSTGDLRDTMLRIGPAGAPEAFVHVGMDQTYAERQIADIRWDILVVLVVSLLVAFELLVFLIDRTIVSPLRLLDQAVARAFQGEWTLRPGRRHRSDEIGSLLGTIDALAREVGDTLLRIDRKLAQLPAVPREVAARVEDLRRRVRPVLDERHERGIRSRANARLPLFLFVFAEELSRSFLPLYAADVYRPIGEIPYLGPLAATLGLGGGLPPEVVIGLPIMVFMGGVALATPFGGSWVGRYGSRTIFLFGAVPATIGYFGTALALTTYDMLVWRMFSAFGYAMITIACQGYLAQVASDGRSRARTMAVFVAAITTAVICGSAIGAVFADRFGYRVTFGIAGLFVLFATALAARYMDQPHDRTPAAAPLRGQFRVFTNPRFLALVVLAAIPAKIALTGFLFYTTPIFLAELDFSQPAIGRMIMLYGLMMLVGTQLGAQLHDRTTRYGLTLVALGGLLTGVALLAPQLYAPGLAMALAISGFGLAQGIASAPMLAALPQLCPNEVDNYGMTSLTGLLRLSERVGSVIGPLLAAFLTLHLSHVDAIASIGLLSALSALLFLIFVGGAAARPVARTADLG